MNRCELCPNVNNCVPPDGPMRYGGLMFVGEAPGYHENKQGIPFVGNIGDEVNRHYLPLAAQHRSNVYFTNAIKCLPISQGGKLDMSQDKDKALLESCATQSLYREIDDMSPRIIVAMGAFACYAIDPEINLELHHGFPIQTRFGPCFPMYHPAGGMHEPKKMLIIRNDWIRLGRYLRGDLHIPDDEYPEPDYKEVESASEFNYLDPTMPLACDTESGKRTGPYCLTYSNWPGYGRLIRAERKDLLDAFQTKLDRWESPVLFHNWLYDRTVVLRMGLRYPDKLIRDTMMRAFHLGNLPLGLKALCYRLLGIEMQDFEDLVSPFSKIEVMQYFSMARALTWEKPEPKLDLDPKSGLWKMKRPHSMNTKLKTFFTNCGKNPDKDVFKAWDNWEDAQAKMEEEIGPYPGMDISHVPFELVLPYACRDADGTRRLWPLLEEMKKAAHTGRPQEEWA